MLTGLGKVVVGVFTGFWVLVFSIAVLDAVVDAQVNSIEYRVKWIEG